MTKAFTTEEIIEKSHEIAHMIANTKEVTEFKAIEAKINENQKVRESLASLRTLQQQLVNFEAIGKEKAVKLVEGKMAKIEEDLDQIPLVQEFKESQVAVNQILQLVSNTVANTVTNEIIESTGGDVLRGKTGSYVDYATPGSCS